MKRLLTFCILLCAAMTASAQRPLTLKDVSPDLAVFSGKDNEAGITISCPGNIELTFESTHDKKVDVFNKELKGEELFYFLRFETGKKYRGRRLTIRAEGFTPIIITAELVPKELRQYQLIDPDAEFVFGTYYEYRKRGNEFFQKSMYNEAKENYLIAKEASDCPEDVNMDELIANIDSIAVYYRRGEEAAILLDYNAAIYNYTNILALNPLDANARLVRNEYLNTYRIEHKKYFDMAEIYKEDGDYEKALELYEKVIDAKIYNAYHDRAAEEVKNIRIRIQNRKMRSRVLLYEFSMQTPIAISYGKYRTRRVGNYFNLSINPDVFGIIREKDTALKPEMSFTPLGWDFNLVPKFPHFWICFGLGYTGAAQYTSSDQAPEAAPKLKFAHAVSPEAGMLVKVWRVALRYTFQYRYTIYSKIPTEIDKIRHSVGLGINF